MKVSQLRDVKRKVEVTLLGQPLNVVYRLSAVDTVSEMITSGKGTKPECIETMVESWGLEDDEGVMIPPTVAAIEEHGVPNTILNAIIVKILDHMSPLNLRTKTQES